MYLAWEAMSFLIPDLYIGTLFPRAAPLRGDLILLIQTQWDMHLHSMSFRCLGIFPLVPTFITQQ